MKKLISVVLVLLTIATASQGNAASYDALNQYMPQAVGDRCQSSWDCDAGEVCYGGGFGSTGICVPRQ